VTILEVAGRASERIESRAKDLTFRKVALTLIAFIPFMIGFAVYFVWRAVWTAITWIFAAGAEGFEIAKDVQSGRKGR
jgi:hypothetical protein